MTVPKLPVQSQEFLIVVDERTIVFRLQAIRTSVEFVVRRFQVPIESVADILNIVVLNSLVEKNDVFADLVGDSGKSSLLGLLLSLSVSSGKSSRLSLIHLGASFTGKGSGRVIAYNEINIVSDSSSSPSSSSPPKTVVAVAAAVVGVESSAVDWPS